MALLGAPYIYDISSLRVIIIIIVVVVCYITKLTTNCSALRDCTSESQELYLKPTGLNSSMHKGGIEGGEGGEEEKRRRGGEGGGGEGGGERGGEEKIMRRGEEEEEQQQEKEKEGAEGYVSGLQDAAASCKPDT